MNIPSNFSLQEVIKYAEMPEVVRDSVASIFDTVIELQEQLRVSEKRQEVLEDQLYFRDEFIRSTMERCENTTKHKDLVRQIKTELYDSCIEF
jgi:hypothetical protein